MMIDMIEVNRLVTTYTMVFRGGRKTRKKKKKDVLYLRKKRRNMIIPQYFWSGERKHDRVRPAELHNGPLAGDQ